MGKARKDVDIVTSARPEQISSLFSHTRDVGVKFAVSLVVFKGEPFEVATFRKEGVYEDRRRPSEVSFGTLEEDAGRRDFTVNALYWDPIADRLVDEKGGQADLEARLIRTVGEASRRFQEDALRLLRAIRFACQLDFEIEEKTWLAVRKNARLVMEISPERQREELTRMLTGPQPARALRMMDEAGLLELLLPEIHAMKGVEQPPEFHPEGDVFTHTCLVVDAVEPRSVIASWGALLHDVGKPKSFRRNSKKKRITFYGHQTIGAEMAMEICKRFRFPMKESKAIAHVVRRHMTFGDLQKMRSSTLRRFLASEHIEDEIAVHRADCIGCHQMLENYEFAKAKLEELGNAENRRLPKPPLNGDDLMRLGIKAGPALGEWLRKLQDRHLEEPFKNREEAERWLLERWER